MSCLAAGPCLMPSWAGICYHGSTVQTAIGSKWRQHMALYHIHDIFTIILIFVHWQGRRGGHLYLSVVQAELPKDIMRKSSRYFHHKIWANFAKSVNCVCVYVCVIVINEALLPETLSSVEDGFMSWYDWLKTIISKKKLDFIFLKENNACKENDFWLIFVLADIK